MPSQKPSQKPSQMPSHLEPLIANPQAGPASTAEPVEVTSPYSGEVLATLAPCSATQIEASLATAQDLFRNKSAWLSLDERCAILETTASIMQTRFDELVVGAAAEGGKPLMDSRLEVKRAIEGVQLCIETIRSEAGAVIPMFGADQTHHRLAFTQKEPIGVVVAVSAFNHPLNLIVHQVAPAIAAGCPVLVKPAEATPLSCHRFVSILHEAGLPPAWCQMIMTEHLEHATALVTDPRVGFFSFIGSAKVGWMLRSRLAAGTRCALEHGGVAPVIVDETADLQTLLPALLKGGYYHAGQVCVSVQRVFVHAKLFPQVAEQLAASAAALRVGDPLSADTEVGPLINAGELHRVDSWIKEATDAGAHLATGGDLLGNGCMQPALLLEPPPETKVTQREIFGPVICLYPYSNLDAAITAANSLPYAFQAAVFAQDIDRAFNIYHQLDASAVMLNDHSAFRQDQMPFAGLRESGLGIGGIPHTIGDMQIDKMMVIKTRRDLL